jgi:hypothetical protein
MKKSCSFEMPCIVLAPRAEFAIDGAGQPRKYTRFVSLLYETEFLTFIIRLGARCSRARQIVTNQRCDLSSAAPARLQNGR